MVNRPPGEFNEQQWYPQLPDGYDGRDRHAGPGQGMSGFPPGFGGPGHGNQTGFPPGHGGPGQGNQPGFPPGHGGHGQGNRPGFPPEHGGPGQGNRPGFPPGHGGSGRPPGQQHGNQAPTSPPPNMAPPYPSAQLFAVDPGAIAGCMYRFTYVWLSRRQGFWFYPVFVGRTSVAGYRWRSRLRRWEYIGLDLNNINTFSCF